MKTALIALFIGFTSFAHALTPAPINAELAKNALVVIRAKKLSESDEVDKYRWYEVQIISVYLNKTGRFFLTTSIKVAALISSPGIPDGTSTLYIENYNDLDPGLWRLVGGSGSLGVSHNTK